MCGLTARLYTIVDIWRMGSQRGSTQLWTSGVWPHSTAAHNCGRLRTYTQLWTSGVWAHSTAVHSCGHLVHGLTAWLYTVVDIWCVGSQHSCTQLRTYGGFTAQLYTIVDIWCMGSQHGCTQL
ncbi:hypothetical protein E2C01_024926 [Portunus trituberculatus]|uniref:Uncharacterized protein n=1 Tax=Portunus trituberculatus TaxID=210409 RepID=A0A5B7EC13_PORTR|nr:hypothetical protein [Portunus trituberculatus]